MYGFARSPSRSSGCPRKHGEVSSRQTQTKARRARPLPGCPGRALTPARPAGEEGLGAGSRRGVSETPPRAGPGLAEAHDPPPQPPRPAPSSTRASRSARLLPRARRHRSGLSPPAARAPRAGPGRAERGRQERRLQVRRNLPSAKPRIRGLRRRGAAGGGAASGSARPPLPAAGGAGPGSLWELERPSVRRWPG